MTRTLHYTEQDLIDAQRLHAVPGPTLRKLVSGIFILVMVYYAQTDQLTNTLFLGTIIGLVSWVMIQFLILIPQQARQLYQRDTSLRRKQSFRWDEEQISIHAEDTAHHIAWRNVKQIKESASVLLIYQDTNHFNLFPKHCFNNQAEIDSFKACLPKP
ncbi:YcxB family protein [Leptothrix ochracea]|uniref:YcxB family protein n=2 Tax=Leptothrix ochracea TaxID=735331 RepID=UPI0034E1E799